MRYIAITAALASLFASNRPAVAADGAQAPVRIGVVFDLSGKRPAAIEVVQGIELAIAEIEKTGRKVQLVKYDSKSDANGTREAMEQLLKDPTDLIIAEVDSSKAVVAAQMAEKAKRVLITPYATSPKVTKDMTFVFRGCFSDDFQGRKLAEYSAKVLHAKRVAIAYDASQLYSETLANEYLGEAKRQHLEIVYNEKLLPDSTNVQELLTRIRASNADVVFLPVYENFAAQVINAGAEMKMASTTFLGGDGWGTSNPFKDLVFKKQKIPTAIWVTHFAEDPTNKAIDRLRDKYSAKYGPGFGGSVAIGYDTTWVAYNAFKAAGRNPSQSAIAASFHKMKPYEGLTGKISFREGQDPTKSLFLYRATPGKPEFFLELKP